MRDGLEPLARVFTVVGDQPAMATAAEHGAGETAMGREKKWLGFSRGLSHPVLKTKLNA